MKRQVFVKSALSFGILASAIAGVACGGAPDGSASTAGSSEESGPTLVAPPTSGASSEGAAAPATSPVGEDAGAPSASAPEDAGAASPPQEDAALPAAPGSLLTAGADIALEGITDDGFVIYRTGHGVDAVSIPTGATRTITASPMGARVMPAGVFLWSASVSPLFRELSFWTGALGLRHLTNGFDIQGPVAASPDGSRTAFLSSPKPFAAASLLVESAGSDPVSLGTACATSLSLGASELTVTGCNSTTDTGAVEQNLAVYGGASLASTIASSFADYSEDPSGTWLWLQGTDGSGSLRRTDTGATVLSDESVGRGIFDAAGDALFYTAGGALKKVSTADASTSTLLPAGCAAIHLLSSDGSKLLADVNGDAVVIATADAKEWDLGTASTPGQGYAFSLDGNYALVRQPARNTHLWNYTASPLGAGLPAASFWNVRSITPVAGSHVVVETWDAQARIVDLAGVDPTIDLPGGSTFMASENGAFLAYLVTAATAATVGAAPGLYVVVPGESPAKQARGHFGT